MTRRRRRRRLSADEINKWIFLNREVKDSLNQPKYKIKSQMSGKHGDLGIEIAVAMMEKMINDRKWWKADNFLDLLLQKKLPTLSVQDEVLSVFITGERNIAEVSLKRLERARLTMQNSVRWLVFDGIFPERQKISIAS